MWTKSLIPIVRSASRVGQKRMSGYTPANWKTAKQIDIENKLTMNDFPVPAGSWQAHHSARNNKWNMMIAGSTAFLIFTIGVMWKENCFFFHGMPDLKKIEIK